MQNKTVLITGGTGGIGKATALGLAKKGAQVIIVGRNAERAAAAVQDIQAQSGNTQVDFLLADLSAQTSIRQLASAFTARYPRLDVLINNVGGLYPTRRETEDGIEAHLAVNHINVLLLTQLLLPTLKASTPARIINVTTGAHRMVAGVSEADLNGQAFTTPIAVYGRAKLINIMVFYELARQLAGTGVTVNIADPGGALTDMTAQMTPAFFPWFMRPMFPIFGLFSKGMTVEKAAVSSIYLASAPEVEGVTGQYYSPTAKPVKSAKITYDTGLAKRLYEASLSLIREPALA